jgi:hypothetical protein
MSLSFREISVEAPPNHRGAFYTYFLFRTILLPYFPADMLPTSIIITELMVNSSQYQFIQGNGVGVMCTADRKDKNIPVLKHFDNYRIYVTPTLITSTVGGRDVCENLYQ